MVTVMCGFPSEEEGPDPIIPHIGTMLHFLNTWNLNVRSELSSFL